jgi:uncharacterized protein YceK
MSSSGRAFLLLLVLSCSGCGTINMLNSDKTNPPLVYSGTRLDWYALQGGCCPEERFGAQSPAWPAIDLPFSLLLDTLLLPLSVAAEMGVTVVVTGGN